jgi:hypothetical protein
MRKAALVRFYFHQSTRDGMVEDPDGSDLPDLAAAVAEALIAARHLWAEAILQERDRGGESFEITDEDGRLLISVPLRNALPESLRHGA